MKILDTMQIRACDQATIENEPISSIDLMERAAGRLFLWIKENYKPGNRFVLFAGTGNNGGDTLALARMMFISGYKNIQVYLLKINSQPSPDCSLNYKRFIEIAANLISGLQEGSPFPEINKEAIIIDGIFGSGLNRPVEGYWAKLIQHINNSNAEIISIDIPSGMFGRDNLNNPGAIITASFTLTLHLPKLPFFFAENEKYTGRWVILPIGLDRDYISNAPTDFYYIEKEDISIKIKTRNRFAHKGTFGHAFLIAGSYQKTGAAVLSAKACLRTGVGLLTANVPETGYQIMQTAVPEAMLCMAKNEPEFCKPVNINKYDAIGIGPGIGTNQETSQLLQMILQNTGVPMVLDADALNILVNTLGFWKNIKPNTILTPHPGEFDRLTHVHSNGYERMLTQIELSVKHSVIIVLKGAFTSISTPARKVYFNSTGNPGMATAGSGDVLTGIILSLLAQGYDPLNAAVAGVYLHGLAGDFARLQYGEEALIASDIIDNLGNAFIELKK